MIAREYRKRVSIMENKCFLQSDREQYFRIIDGSADTGEVRASLNQLSEYLFHYYGKKVLIFLDEYDTPMQEAFVNGYWEELTDFMRGFLNASFKTNPYLGRGIMTGITRVGKESIFSDLNNLSVITAASRLYETAFGFTEYEVQEALHEYGLQDESDKVKLWYDVLLAGGYLKIVKTGVWNRESCESGIEDISYELALTNQEIVFLFKKLIRGWFDHTDAAYNGFIKAMLADNVKEMNAYMNKAVPLLLSCFDTGNRPSAKTEPERLHSVKATTKGLKEPNPSVCFYHGLVLGIIVDLAKKYIITSNRESGLGRYDVMLEPRSLADDGIIFEFKVFDGDGENGLMDTVHAAIRQILNKKYAAVLEDKLVDKSRIRIYGFAFRGKEVLIDGGYLAKYESAQYHALLEGYDYS